LECCVHPDDLHSFPTRRSSDLALELLDAGARRARSELLSDDPLAAADILILTGVARQHLSRYDLAEDDLSTAVALLEKNNAAKGPGARELVLAKLALAEIYWNTGRLQEGIDVSERALAIGSTNALPREDLLEAKLSIAQATAYLDPEASATLAREVLDEALAAGFSETYLHRDILQTLG